MALKLGVLLCPSMVSPGVHTNMDPAVRVKSRLLTLSSQLPEVQSMVANAVRRWRWFSLMEKSMSLIMVMRWSSKVTACFSPSDCFGGSFIVCRFVVAK